MSTTVSHTPFTPEDLLNLPDAVRYELVDGNLVERHMGAESSAIAAKIIVLLGMFLRGRRLGELFGSDTSYECFADAPGKVRRADVGFVRLDRLPGGRPPKGHLRVAPDLAVEVVSPNDTSEEVDEKVQEWLAAGVPLVWVVSPAIRAVRVYRPRTAPNGRVSLLSFDDTISGEDVLPGFSCPVREFFENI
jgi:Uma2 family endonuclease